MKPTKGIPNPSVTFDIPSKLVTGSRSSYRFASEASLRLTPEQLALLYLQIEPKIADQFVEHYRALEAELDNWKDISGQAHDACVEAEAERDAARGEALRPRNHIPQEVARGSRL
jgi:hypothetical protein